MKNLIKNSLSFFSLFIIITLVVMILKPWKSPESWLEDFYSNSSSEEKIIDPLLLAGQKVIPLVLTSIKDKEMKKRRYAIEFLGYSGEKKSLLVLQEIFNDKSEKDYIRGDALEAIYHIAPESGKKIAHNYSYEEEYISMVAKEIINSKSGSIEKRTLIDAMIGW